MLEELEIPKVNVIGISYGAFIVEKMMTFKPNRIKKCILVLPSGIVNGHFWKSTKKEKHLRSFLSAFAPMENQFLCQMLSTMMKGIKLDTRIPKLLKKQDVQHFDAPVYVIAAKEGVHFPGEKIIQRCKNSLFPPTLDQSNWLCNSPNQ